MKITMDTPPQFLKKILSQDQALAQIKAWKNDGEKIVFTNGVFDILHPGHVTYLEDAASRGDHLIIGLNGDKSVKNLGKGDDRPINNEQNRAIMLSALSSTSMIVLFNDDTPLSLIKLLQPDVLIKGGDYEVSAKNGSDKYIVGSEEMKTWGGVAYSIDFLPGHSTTSIIRKIKGGNGKD